MVSKKGSYKEILTLNNYPKCCIIKSIFYIQNFLKLVSKWCQNSFSKQMYFAKTRLFSQLFAFILAKWLHSWDMTAMKFQKSLLTTAEMVIQKRL